MIDDKVAVNGVLVVDDEPLVLKYTTSVLTSLGCERVLKAGNAQDARAVLLTEKLSLVICDFSLPDGDGRQILSEALEENPAVSGVLITGFATGDLKLPAELRGHVRLLEKPFTAGDISQILAELAEERTEPAHPNSAIF